MFLNSYISGMIPSAMSSHLHKLVSLDLSHNDLSFEGNSFENLLGNLTQRRELFLDAIDLSWVAPTYFQNLSSSIMVLSLSDNDLHGELPEGIFRFPYLQKLRITDHDSLEVNFPKSNWSSPLRSLEVFSVNIARELPLPSSIGNLRFLEVLDLGFCNLKGSIPFSFSNFNQLRYLDLSGNQLHGQFPDVFGNLTKLFHLSLRDNQFSGHLPFSVFDLSHIVYLDMSQNKLVGSLPSQVSGLSLLSSLDLSGNFLSGRIPPSLFTLPSLFDLYLNDIKFTGPIDQFDQPSASSESVYLMNNEIHGPIPSSVFALLNLTSLDLSSNKLTGISEPNNLPNLNKLENLDLSNNTLLSFKKGLEELDLSYNRINAIEADMFSKLKNLRLLDLSHNSQLSLSTTNNVSLFLLNLRSLSCSSCNISEFSDFVRNLEGLEELVLSYNRINVIEADLSNNSIQGKISMGQSEGWPSLTWLDLSNNVLTDIEHYPWKNTINLSNNDLDGLLPKSLMNCSQLEVLNVGNNKISDNLS
ncbi:probable LRR receptor-like serine/threonine-protein kinase At4g36180 [Durio zibethinus]|uniref:Probable LRR receptor-like serine/threonine-protein kinase At4g36180 n=1 Tax=Durio zibethinus TaxID=66656 RepID=A0A6P5WKZ2_DURZI|nr:probable LRR receptor-like serine/threonine-protein kinase At4g36180 [Durio zibethinus]